MHLLVRPQQGWAVARPAHRPAVAAEVPRQQCVRGDVHEQRRLARARRAPDLGFGGIVALHHCASTLYQIR
jgi:hypothetical protein